MDENLDYKGKYEESERNLQNLKDLSHKAIADYEDLKKKYDQNHKQFELLKERLQESEENLEKVNKLIQPVYEEYSELEVKCSIEEQLKNEAERYATKVTTENSKLKRQSQMLLDMVSDHGVSVSQLATITQSDQEDEEAERESQTDHYNNIIQELRDKVAELETKYRTAEEEKQTAVEQERVWKNKFEVERSANKATETSLREHKSSLKNFQRVSMLAYREYEDLQEKLELEKNLKEKAMQYASKMLSQKNTMHRQSAAVITEAAADERVHKAFIQIEELSSTLEQERTEHQTKISELEEALEKSSDVRSVTSLQEQVDTFDQQVKDLKQQLKDMTLWRDKLEKSNKDLTDKLDVAEQRLRPPPPPPPPPVPTILKPLHKIMKKKPKAGAAQQNAATKGNPALQSALDEMMDRIKKGDIKKSLKSPCLRKSSDDKILSFEPSLPENSTQTEGSSMNELHGLLSNLKRSKSVDSGQPADNNNKEENNELSTILRKRFQKTTTDLSAIDEKCENKEESEEGTS